MANTILVSTPASVNEISTDKNQDAQEDSNIASSTRGSSPSVSQTSASWMSFVQSSLINQGVTGEPLNTILESWRSGTRKQYQTYVSAWTKFSSDNSINPMNPTLQQVLEFLSFQSKTVGYSAVATARSALSTFIKIDSVKVGDHPLVSRFMSGLFNLKPALPRYTETWNPQIVLNHLKTYPTAGNLSLKQLTQKLVMLMALLSAQRTQTLQKLSLEGMTTSPGKYIFHVSSLLKQTSAKGGQNRHLFPIIFTSYNVDKRLCVVELLTAYIERTASLRKSTKQLLICYVAPHGPASKDTISRWIRQTMKDAGINTSVFKPHSTRGAATSAAKAANVPIHEIMHTAGWRSDSTFAKFYDRPITNESTFAEAILTSSNQ